jgi:hypothetical protein
MTIQRSPEECAAILADKNERIRALEADNALLRAFVVADDCLMNSHTQSRADHLRHITEYKSARVALDAAGVMER